MIVMKKTNLMMNTSLIGQNTSILKIPSSDSETPKAYKDIESNADLLVNQQQHINESLEEKKRRLFKWSYYEKVMLPLTFIKEKLLQNTNIIRFFSLFCDFT